MYGLDLAQKSVIIQLLSDSALMTVMLAVRGWVVQDAGQARNTVGGSTLPLIFPAIYEYLVAPGTLLSNNRCRKNQFLPLVARNGVIHSRQVGNLI